MDKPGRLPMSPGLPLLGHLPRVARDGILKFLLDEGERHGDVFGLQLGSRRSVCVSHPEHFRHVLKSNRDNYLKLGSYDVLRPLLGDGLVTSNGDQWAKNRRLADPAFRRKKISALLPVMASCTDAAIERWRSRDEPEAPLDLGIEMTKLTLEIVSGTLFGVDLNDKRDRSAEVFRDALHRMSERSNRVVPIPNWLPTPDNLRLKRALRTLDETVREIVEEGSCGDAGERPTLVHQLIHAVDPQSGRGFSPTELRDEAMTMVFAGHETMATTLMWGWHLLSEQPEVVARMRQEADSVFGDRHPDIEDLASLEYTGMVIDEILRLRNPVWAIGRDAVEADEVGSAPVRAGDGVTLSIYQLHRHPEFWERPEEFSPERFAPGVERHRHPFQYLPFSGGARFCIGRSFALAEAKVLFSMLSQRVRFEPVDDSVVEPIAEITIRPSRPIVMRPRYLS